MVDISILVLHNAVPAAIADASYVFSIVNGFLEEAGKAPLFRVRLVGLTDEVKLNNGLFGIKPDALITDVDQTNLVIIPSMTGDALAGTYLNKDYAPWISQQYKNGAEIASLCVGAFLLAYSGLLRGKQCTTHWAYANEFRYYYPDVKLVEKYTNREIAIRTAKFFVIDLDRKDQSPFIIFTGQKNHKDPVIIQAQEYMEQNYTAKLGVEQIAGTVNMTRRTFERRLEIGRKSITEVMYEVGYTDVKNFRDVFKKITGSRLLLNPYSHHFDRK